MLPEINVCDLINRGGVYTDIDGENPEQIYNNVSRTVKLPDNLFADVLARELNEREKVMSTAVGNGISIPHPRYPLVKTDDEQRLYVCYLKHTIDMHAPDARKVYVMFIILSSSTQNHLGTLSKLAALFQNAGFRKLLEDHAGTAELCAAVEKITI